VAATQKHVLFLDGIGCNPDGYKPRFIAGLGDRSGFAVSRPAAAGDPRPKGPRAAGALPDTPGITALRTWRTKVARAAVWQRAPNLCQNNLATLDSVFFCPQSRALPTQLTSRFQDALCLAAQLHARQFRKASSVPYAAHLLAVTALVLEHGGDEDEAIASLLHDAVEDQGGPPVLAEIERRFGQAVARIVEGCTDTDQTPKPPWRERKQAHIARVKEASRSIQLVVAADKLHNVRSMIADYRRLGPGLWSRFTASGPETLWYYRAMADVLRAGIGGDLVKELDAAIAELSALVAAGETPKATE
jgi:hypothetical protein